jgi:phage portal protein BeeE
MGVISGAVLGNGGRATGVIPYAMVQAGGEKEAVQRLSTANGESLTAKGGAKVSDQHATLSSEAKERVSSLLVTVSRGQVLTSMH